MRGEPIEGAHRGHPVPSGRLGVNEEEVDFPRLLAGAACVTVHVILTKTLAPFSQKRSLGHEEAELEFRLGGSVWHPEWKGHRSWNFLSWSWLGCPSKKGCSVQSYLPFTPRLFPHLCGIRCRLKEGGGVQGFFR